MRLVYEVLPDSRHWQAVMDEIGKLMQQGCAVQQSLVTKADGRVFERYEITNAPAS
jgi:hypothetical protein